MPFNLLQTCFTFTTSNLQSCLIVERTALAETIRLFKNTFTVIRPQRISHQQISLVDQSLSSTSLETSFSRCPISSSKPRLPSRQTSKITKGEIQMRLAYSLVTSQVRSLHSAKAGEGESTQGRGLRIAVLYPSRVAIVLNISRVR